MEPLRCTCDLIVAIKIIATGDGECVVSDEALSQLLDVTFLRVELELQSCVLVTFLQQVGVELIVLASCLLHHSVELFPLLQ